LANRNLRFITALLVFIMVGSAHGQAPPMDGRIAGGLQPSGLGAVPSGKAPVYSISASPNPVAPGQTITFNGLLNPQLTASGVTVTLRFFNSSGTPTGQASTTGVNFVAGNATAVTISHAVLAKQMPVGTYTYNLAFRSSSNALLRAKANAGGFAVQKTSAKLTSVCATAVVVGLTWSAISGATGYVVARNGANLTSASLPITYTSYVDQTVTPSSSYLYSVTAVNASGNIFAFSLPVSTPAATPNGDPAYCPSSVIKSMTWNWSAGFNQQNSSDLWAQTWGSDGNDYGFFGDGLGFFGTAKTSFGIGTLTGSAGPISQSNAMNVYGGGNGLYPASITGKATALLAVGSDYYAIGSVWQPSDPPNNGWGAPDHVEIEFSPGNPYSWQSNYTAWSFCAAGLNPAGFCPVSLLQYGPGYASARDSYVYLYGMPAQNFFGNGTPGPAYTYLFRVPTDQILTQAAYQTFAGVDNTGNPTWSSTWSDMQPVFTDPGPRPMGISGVVYNSALGRFIAEGQGGYVNQAVFYDAPNPWGPWTSIGYYNSNPDNTGGWGNLGTTSFAFGQNGDSLGINFINKWSSATTMWAVFSSNGLASTGASLPSLAGQSMDSFNLVSVTLNH
jgi:hypothetical protein